MFKIGDKAKGFKFDGGTDGVHYNNEMDDYVGVVGEVAEVYSDSFVIMFPDHLEWMYPISLWNLAKVEETQPFNVGDKVIPSFQIGDRVKFKKSSLDSGMVDATEDDVFMVVHINSSREAQIQIWITGYPGWWNIDHFEHVKEGAMTNTDDAMNNTEEQEIKWEVGQEVWCTSYGRGKIDKVDNEVAVLMENGEYNYYSLEGKMYKAINRTLFFSEPKIEAEKFPPKKPFVPKLKKGDVIIYRQRGSSCSYVGVVEYEDHDSVALEDSDDSMYKHAFEFHKLGEEIKFS